MIQASALTQGITIKSEQRLLGQISQQQIDPFEKVVLVKGSIDNSILTSFRTLNQANNMISDTMKVVHTQFLGSQNRNTFAVKYVLSNPKRLLYPESDSEDAQIRALERIKRETRLPEIEEQDEEPLVQMPPLGHLEHSQVEVSKDLHEGDNLGQSTQQVSVQETSAPATVEHTQPSRPSPVRKPAAKYRKDSHLDSADEGGSRETIIEQKYTHRKMPRSKDAILS